MLWSEIKFFIIVTLVHLLLCILFCFTGSLNIDITVVDSNDNNPKFTNSTYAVNTLENIAIGTTLVTVQATDPDEGSNGAVAYYFAKSTVNSYGSLFGIDRVTGGIYTKVIDFFFKLFYFQKLSKIKYFVNTFLISSIF